MASRKSPSSGRSAPKAKGRLAAFCAYVDALANDKAVANDKAAASDAALVRALNKRDVMRCSALWKTFAQQVGDSSDHRPPPVRVLPPSQALAPLP